MPGRRSGRYTGHICALRDASRCSPKPPSSASSCGRRRARSKASWSIGRGARFLSGRGPMCLPAADWKMRACCLPPNATGRQSSAGRKAHSAASIRVMSPATSPSSNLPIEKWRKLFYFKMIERVGTSVAGCRSVPVCSATSDCSTPPSGWMRFRSPMLRTAPVPCPPSIWRWRSPASTACFPRDERRRRRRAGSRVIASIFAICEAIPRSFAILPPRRAISSAAVFPGGGRYPARRAAICCAITPSRGRSRKAGPISTKGCRMSTSRRSR